MGVVGGSCIRTRTGPARRIGFAALLVALVSFAAMAHGEEPSPASGAAGEAPEERDAAEIGKKLANPVSNVWALFTEYDVNFSSGNVNKGGSRVGSQMLFQPVLPFPLYGKGDDAWKFITRPVIPIVFSTPIPTGPNQFAHKGGLADIQLPMLVSPPAGHWILGAGPNLLLPTATNKALGQQQWGIGPAAVVGYKTDELTVGVFPQYYFGVASSGDRSSDVPDASFLNMLYFAFYNLPHAWQIGFNPTISYNRPASSGSRWNVPIGLTLAKTTWLGPLPVKFQFGAEYSVVSQDEFGQRAQIKFNVIPVIPSLVKEPILGGG